VTFGPEVAELCAVAGFDPDADQRLLLDLIFAVDAAGRASAFEVGVCGPRQNFKTGLFKQAVIGWLFVTDQRLVVWSAHEFSTTQEAFRDLDEIVTGSDVLRRRVKAIHRGNGDEAIELVGDRRVKFKARTQGGGRGLTADKDVLDESMFLLPAHMGALLPTLAARPDPQVLYGGSAGLARSVVWRGVRDRGRAGSSPRLAWAEYCDDLPGECEQPACAHEVSARGCRLDDEARWARANLALGRRITVEYIRAERKALPPEEFGRERLGWWDEPEQAIDEFLAAWLANIDVNSVPSGSPVFSIDVSPGSRSAAIGVAARNGDGLPHLDVAAHAPKTDWVVARAVELNDKHDPAGWVLDPASQAGALLPDLLTAGIEPRQMTGREMGQACGDLAAKNADAAVRHLGEESLTRAISGAGVCDIGDGLWAWSRRRSDVDICPLVAVTEAAWLLSTIPDDEPGVFFL
jgi:hypothetical protein